MLETDVLGAPFGRLPGHDVRAVGRGDSRVGAMCVCDYFEAGIGYQKIAIWV